MKRLAELSDKNHLKHSIESDVEDNMERSPAIVDPMLSWKVKTERFSPVFQTNYVPKLDNLLEPAQKWITFPGKLMISFPIKTIQPRIRTGKNFSNEIPMDVQVERLRKEYEKLDLEDLLNDYGIENWMLTPINVLDRLLAKSNDQSTMFQRKSLFPLDWFDDRGYESMSPRDWLNLGYYENVRHPIPAKAFLPKRFIDNSLIDLNIKNPLNIDYRRINSLDFEEPFIDDNVDYLKMRNNLYAWCYVAVKDYDSSTDKWIAIDLETMWIYKIPRIFLMFIAENPYEFIKRIKDALNNREEAENLLKFELIIDCLLTSDVNEIPTKLLNKIHNLTVANLKFYINDEFFNDLKSQVNFIYQRILVKYEFLYFLCKNPEEFPTITIPKDINKINQINKIVKQIEIPYDSDYKDTRLLLKKIHILYATEAINAMYMIITECINIEKMSLFSYSFNKNATLHDFESTQEYHCNTITKYLKGFWIEHLAEEVCISLRALGKGWHDITINDWNVFKKSKIFRFLLQTRYRMEASMRIFLQQSIINYTKYLLNPFDDNFNNIDENFTWNDDLITSPFMKPSSTKIFHMLIHLSNNGGHYSTDPDLFPLILTQILENSLLLTNGIPQIDPFVMRNLVFSKSLSLPTVELIENLFIENKNVICETYKKAIIPLKAYARKFDIFTELYLTNVSDYVEEFFDNNKTSYEFKEEVQAQKRSRDYLKAILPPSIIIGPFGIHVDPLKQLLIDKCSDIITKLLELFCQRLYDQTFDLLAQYNDIMIKLTEKPLSIENLLKIREFITTIPKLLETYGEKLHIILLDYDMLDYFLYNLTDDHFSMKWELIGWPHQIFLQIAITKEQQKHDIEEFKKLQFQEIQLFFDQTEILTNDISKYFLQYNDTKAQEISIEIKKTWKNLHDLLVHGELLQSRQKIFDLDELSLETLKNLIEGFQPLRNLWISCADFLKFKDMTFFNPLATIDLNEIKENLKRIENTLMESIIIFSDKLEISNVSQMYLNHINELQPCIEIIEYLKNPNWLIYHWQELAREGKIDIKYSPSITFSYCMKKGIMDLTNLVKEIGERAVLEADLIKKSEEEQERIKNEENLKLLAKRKQRKGRTSI